jgi:tRNA (guanine37-N1)-methyltransferase
MSLLEDEFIIICGHYEGIDQRIIDIYVDYKISI